MIRVGTRSSRLAQAQTQLVLDGLASRGHAAEARPLDTLGDRERTTPVHELGVAGAFTSGLEVALLEERIDLAVHSLKDLPIENPDGLTIAAILERGPPQDALVAHPESLDDEQPLHLARGARVGTSGPRRQSQLLAERRDLAITNVRGNVDTRIGKLREGRFDALVTARVAIDRMEFDLPDLTVLDLPADRFPPAPGQAAIAVQAREGSQAAKLAQPLDHRDTRRAVETERRLLDELGGGCGLPLGAWVHRTEDGWHLASSFAGRDWRPDDEPRVLRAEVIAGTPEALVEPALAEIRHVQPRPRRPDLAQVPQPDGAPVLVVASRPTAREWAAMLRSAGQASLAVPTRSFDRVTPGPSDRALLGEADWIGVTSRQAAGPLAEAFEDTSGARFAAVGPATARSLQGQGLACHLIAPSRTGKSLAQILARVTEPDETIVLAQGDRVHGDAREHLHELGRTVEIWEAYRTREIPIDPVTVETALPARAALVMSPRNAQAIAHAGADRLAERYIALGPSTANELGDLGLDPDQARAPTPEAVLELIG